MGLGEFACFMVLCLHLFVDGMGWDGMGWDGWLADDVYAHVWCMCMGVKGRLGRVTGRGQGRNRGKVSVRTRSPFTVLFSTNGSFPFPLEGVLDDSRRTGAAIRGAAKCRWSMASRRVLLLVDILLDFPAPVRYSTRALDVKSPDRTASGRT